MLTPCERGEFYEKLRTVVFLTVSLPLQMQNQVVTVGSLKGSEGGRGLVWRGVLGVWSDFCILWGDAVGDCNLVQKRRLASLVVPDLGVRKSR